jgi:hypothetical protein
VSIIDTDFAGTVLVGGVLLALSVGALIPDEVGDWMKRLLAWAAWPVIAVSLFASYRHYAFALSEVFSGYPVVRYVYVHSILFGPFWYIQIAYLVCIAAPQLLWFRSIREHPLNALIVGLITTLAPALNYGLVLLAYLRHFN